MSDDTRTEEGPTNRRPFIAVLNDSLELLKLMQYLLVDEGYDVEIMHATDGAQLRIVELKPDLLILDMIISEPDDGWQLLQIIKLDPRTSKIPVIICSATVKLLSDNKEQLDKLGCYIMPKPFDLDDLVNMVRVALGGSAA
jgi:DNA-binding response OmpR family regulator